ncbi:MAG: AMP-binding protein [Cyanobacteria bacterium P01_F01_bin.42]
MTQFANLVDLLQARAESAPERVIYRFLEDGETEVGQLSYRELDEKARAIAAHLQAQKAQGKHVLLIYPYPAGLEFIAAFMGCLYTGAVAVTDNPPYNLDGFKKLGDRIQSSEAQFFLSTQDFLNTVEQALTQLGPLPTWVKALKPTATDRINPAEASDWIKPTLEADQTAFLQYTSGSTGIPKGVQVTHGNLMHNVQVIQDCFEVTPEPKVRWRQIW